MIMIKIAEQLSKNSYYKSIPGLLTGLILYISMGNNLQILIGALVYFIGGLGAITHLKSKGKLE